MSVLIKSMFMPESCNEWGNGICPFLDTEIYNGFDEDAFDFLCVLTENVVENIDMRPKWCPLVEVPKHGRLIDADAFEKYCDQKWIPLNVDALHGAPTVIEAEE